MNPWTKIGLAIALVLLPRVAVADEVGVEGELAVYGTADPLPSAREIARSAEDVLRGTSAYTDAEIRCGCDLATAMQPVEMRDRLSRAEARALAHVSWADLEMPAADVVTATCGDREAHYIVNGSGFDGRCGR